MCTWRDERAHSVPLHCHASQNQLNGAASGEAKLGGAAALGGDIRLDEDYDRFYRAQVPGAVRLLHRRGLLACLHSRIASYWCCLRRA